jgi:Cip1-like, core domain
MSNFRVSLSAVACACALLSACAGGPGGTGTAGSSGGGAAGTGTAGNGAAGTGVAGNGAAGNGVAGTTGLGGTGGGVAGSGVAGTLGTAGTTGSAGTGGTAGGSGGSAGSVGTAGTGGTVGTAGNGGRGGASAGAGGRGGGGGVGAGGGATGAGGSTSTGFFSDNFESGTVGMQPSGWNNFIAYVANSANPNGTTLALVDSTRAHSGTKSVHFHGGQSPTQLTRALPSGTTKLYVRAWIWFTRQLGMNPGANHETLIGIRKLPGQANDEVRFGEIKGVIGTNEVPTDNISPKMAQWGLGPVVAPGGWRCIEVAFLADQPQHTLTAWADSVMVHSITAPDQWQNGNMPMNWLNGKFVEVIMGWQSFSGIDTDLWIDDVVLSNAPIGCN